MNTPSLPHSAANSRAAPSFSASDIPEFVAKESLDLADLGSRKNMVR